MKDNGKQTNIDLLSIINAFRAAPVERRHRFVPTQKSSTDTVLPRPSHITEIDGTIIQELPRSIGSHFETETLPSDVVTSHFTADGESEKIANPAPRRRKKGVTTAVRLAGRAAEGAAGAGAFTFKLVAYIAVVLIISAYAAYYLVSLANDVFAFVKEPLECTVTISENTTPDSVVTILQNEGIIRYGDLFRVYMEYQADGEEIVLIQGDHTFNGTMNYSQIYSELTIAYVPRTIVRVTIPEGLTTDEIIDLLVENGLGTKENYVEAINNYPYKHEFVQQLSQMELSPDRTYRLDGYLFPDTYQFYSDLDEYLVINKLLNNFVEKFWKDYKKTYKAKLDAKGLTFDDLVTLASIVEEEGKAAQEYEYIAYVFYNRLSHSDTYPQLQSDATVNYVLSLSGLHEEDLTQASLDIVHPYNTYIFGGLTPGAICNPGLDAILGTIYPTAPYSYDSEGNVIDVDAYYFVSSKLGNTYYAKTLAEHKKNIKTVEAENKEYEAAKQEDAQQ